MHAAYLKTRLDKYNAMLERWRKLLPQAPWLQADIDDLERYRSVIYERWISADRKERRKKLAA